MYNQIFNVSKARMRDVHQSINNKSCVELCVLSTEAGNCVEFWVKEKRGKGTESIRERLGYVRAERAQRLFSG